MKIKWSTKLKCVIPVGFFFFMVNGDVDEE